MVEVLVVASVLRSWSIEEGLRQEQKEASEKKGK